MPNLNRRTFLTAATAASTAVALGPMPVVAPARAAAPLAGKQNAGWYRYKVGSFEVTVVTDGANDNPLAPSYVANASKDQVNAALTASYMPADRAIHQYTPIVVNTGSQLVVMDTGLGPQLYAKSKGAVGQFQTNLAAAGIDRNAVDAVIISHFHGDHINGLLDADNKPAYPKAQVLVPAAEWNYWMDDGQMSKAPDALKGNFNNSRRVFKALGDKVTRYEAGKEVVPGITAVASYGHTLGHTSHIIASGSDRVLVQADITAGMAALFLRNPDWQLMFDMDKPMAVATRRKLYDMAATDKMLVQGFHLNFPGRGYVEKDGNGYRWSPANWNPLI
jgi:glyoxylase-like metal-dependent hydrolase (beta-lactamase superfamily II)